MKLTIDDAIRLIGIGLNVFQRIKEAGKISAVELTPEKIRELQVDPRKLKKLLEPSAPDDAPQKHEWPPLDMKQFYRDIAAATRVEGQHQCRWEPHSTWIHGEKTTFMQRCSACGYLRVIEVRGEKQ